MHIEGRVEASKQQYRSGEPISAALIITNQGDEMAWLFVPSGRAGGIEIEVKQGRTFEVKDMLQEPEPGLQSETKIAPGETLKHQIPLSEWLVLSEPDSYVVECTIPIEVANRSLRDRDSSSRAELLTIRSNLRFTIL